MNRFRRNAFGSAFPIRIAGVAGVITLVFLVLVAPAGALSFLDQTTPEPSPRPTATSAPYLQLDPVQGVAGDATPVTATGGLWVPGQAVSLYWDDTSLPLGNTVTTVDGAFEMDFETPTDPDHATVGHHKVLAVQGALQAEADFELIAATATPTYTPTNTPEPPTPTYTPTPVTPSPTPPPTTTPTPSPTLRPVTPMVTITPFPPTQPPATTNTPAPTHTNTPVPGTPTNTLTPSVTPTASNTPGPGTPAATPQPSATPVEEISETGGGWGTVFLWGFVLAGLLVVFRLLRVRGLPGQG